jgi:tetratricopeptide (TPR) repeat protein
MNAFAGRKKTALARAERLFKQRQFAQVIRILEPQITSYRENTKFFYLLGMSCLSTGDYGGAYVYFRRCTDIDYRNTNAQLGLAVVHLRRGENEESLRIWLEILQEDARNRYARLGLKTVRKYAGEDEGGAEALFENRKDLALVPSPGFYLPRGVKWFIAGFLLLAFVLLPAALIVKNRLNQTPEPSRPEIAAVKIETGESVLDTTSRALNMLTEQEVRSGFGKIKELFEAGEDNHARREINRLLWSNAGQTIKNKIRLFIPFIRSPTFADFPESFTYQEVMADPLLYEGCFVRWKGRISNINIEPSRITLDFLAGYEDQKVLLGIVPSWMEFAATLQSDFAYELIAKIVLPSGRPGIMLQILSLHELGL